MPTPKPVSYKQLCVIAKAILTADPSLDNFEWSERIKDQLAKARLGYPERPDAIHAAMRNAERLVPRPAPWFHPPPPPKPEPSHEAPTPEGLARRDAILEQIRNLAHKHTMPTVHGPTKTAEQIQAWRLEQFANRKPTHIKTPKGWVPL